jgi:plastocyanin
MTETAPAATTPTTGRSKGLVIGLVVVFLLPVVAAVALLAVVMSNSSDGPQEVSFTVPADTSERLANGETVEVLPAQIDLAVGDTLVIENLDSESYDVGPYLVGANQTLRQTFNEPGLFEGVCTLHPSGGIQIVVGGGMPPEDELST